MCAGFFSFLFICENMKASVLSLCWDGDVKAKNRGYINKTNKTNKTREQEKKLIEEKKNREKDEPTTRPKHVFITTHKICLCEFFTDIPVEHNVKAFLINTISVTLHKVLILGILRDLAADCIGESLDGIAASTIGVNHLSNEIT